MPSSRGRITKTQFVLVNENTKQNLKWDALLTEMVREMRRMALTMEVLLEEVRSLNRRLAAETVKKIDADKSLSGDDTGS